MMSEKFCLTTVFMISACLIVTASVSASPAWQVIQGLNQSGVASGPHKAESGNYVAIFVSENKPATMVSSALSHQVASAVKKLMLYSAMPVLRWLPPGRIPAFSGETGENGVHNVSPWSSPESFRRTGAGFKLSRALGVQGLIVLFSDDSTGHSDEVRGGSPLSGADSEIMTIIVITLNPPGTRQTTLRVRHDP